MAKIQIRGIYDFDPDKLSVETGLRCLDKSLTVQDQTEEADINMIVKRYGLTGEFPQASRVPTYGDFTGVSDYREAIHAVREADAAFMALPADIRSRFNNDPASFVDFCSDPANLDTLRQWGFTKENVSGQRSESDSKSGNEARAPAGERSGERAAAGGGTPSERSSG